MIKETFERVGFFSRGYNAKQVDAFLDKARKAYKNSSVANFDPETVANVTFDAQRRGYRPDLVDAALDRLASAFIQRKRTYIVSQIGESTWLDQTYNLAKTLYPRILRPAGQRFADADGVGYNKDEVDECLDRLGRYFDGNEILTASDIRFLTFTPEKGSAAYDMAVVDVYLERAISVLISVE